MGCAGVMGCCEWREEVWSGSSSRCSSSTSWMTSRSRGQISEDEEGGNSWDVWVEGGKEGEGWRLQ